jgi:hypothetical protein
MVSEMVSRWCPSEGPLTLNPARLVEPDGIEPSTSTMPLCLRNQAKRPPRKGLRRIAGHHLGVDSTRTRNTCKPQRAVAGAGE